MSAGRRAAPLTRTFLAVFPPPHVAAALGKALASIARPGEGVSWVRARNVHYTLRFLGDLPPGRVEAAQRAATAAVVGIAPFHVRLGGVGAFPNPARARALWLGAAEGADSLTLLAKSLEIALGREGFGGGDHPFTPHLTLGRVRDAKAAPAALAKLEALALPELTFTVGALDVVASTLHTEGSIYQTLATGRLAG